MPKRRTDDVEPESRTDSGIETKSRSGRLVKPKVYNDGTVALVDGKDHMEGGLPHGDLKTGYAHFNDLDDDEELSDVSEGSYGSTRTRTARGASNLGRLDSTRPSRRTTTRPRTSNNSTHAAGYGGGGVFKQAAVEILRSERRLMSTGEIARLALRRGLLRCTGKTPEATMASALYTDIKRKEGHSLFVRPREGLFGLREWVDEGVVQITPHQINSTTQHLVPLPSSHHLHLHHHAPPAAAMDSDNLHHYDGEQQPGASEDSGDRLMELLCAAEEINRDEVSPPSEAPHQNEAQVSEGDADIDGQDKEHDAMYKAVNVKEQQQQQTAAEVAAVEEALDAANQAAAAVLGERHASTTLPTTTSTLKTAELQVESLERLHGATHPEVGLGYLHLAQLYLGEKTSIMNSGEKWRTRAYQVLQKAQEALIAYQHVYASNLTSSSLEHATKNVLLPGTATKSKQQQGFFVPAPPGPLKTPRGPPHGAAGPVAAPTPLALEEARGWNAGPFSAVPPSSIQAVVAPAGNAAGTTTTTAAPAAPLLLPTPAGVASDVENDADMLTCLPSAPGKVCGTKRLPLHAVAAPLTAS